MRAALQEYVDTVVPKSGHSKGVVPGDAWQPLRLHKYLVTFQPTTRGEEVVQAEFLRTLNDLYPGA